jgi:hypothetical protein
MPDAPRPPDNRPFFPVAVVGDPSLGEDAYPTVRDALDRLLARCLPRVDVAFLLQDSFGRLADRYACERKALKTGVSGGNDPGGELLRAMPKAIVVFAAADAASGEAELRPEERRLVERARERGIGLRVVGVPIGETTAPSIDRQQRGG